MIRALTSADLDEMKELHLKYFPNEALPDFMNYVCAFVIEEQGKTVTMGGIRDIAECVAVTDLSLDPKIRIRALYQLLDASTFVCKRSGYDQMYVWSQDPKYTRRLKRNGFRPPVGQSLILDL